MNVRLVALAMNVCFMEKYSVVLKMTHPFVHNMNCCLAHGLYVHPMLPSTCTYMCVSYIKKIEFYKLILTSHKHANFAYATVQMHEF